LRIGQDVFVCTEEDIKGIRFPVGGNGVEIAGRVDAVRFHPRNELEVVDYKLSQGAQQKSDFGSIVDLCEPFAVVAAGMSIPRDLGVLPARVHGSEHFPRRDGGYL